MKMEMVYEYKLPNGIFRVFNSKDLNFDFLKTKQTHSDIVVNEKEIVSDIIADAIVGNTSKPKCILTADCLPIIVEGEFGHATVHAGWAGVKNNILFSKKIAELKPKLFFIGPHILFQNYQVQENFKEHFPNSDAFIYKNNNIYFDLASEIKNRIKQNYPNAEIMDSQICTFEDHRFHSYRRNKTEQRNYNIYFPNGEVS
jgi:copper oxidase (laccase) domain-containing protein